jgi:hypothetical protein
MESTAFRRTKAMVAILLVVSIALLGCSGERPLSRAAADKVSDGTTSASTDVAEPFVIDSGWSPSSEEIQQLRAGSDIAVFLRRIGVFEGIPTPDRSTPNGAYLVDEIALRLSPWSIDRSIVYVDASSAVAEVEKAWAKPLTKSFGEPTRRVASSNGQVVLRRDTCRVRGARSRTGR